MLSLKPNRALREQELERFTRWLQQQNARRMVLAGSVLFLFALAYVVLKAYFLQSPLWRVYVLYAVLIAGGISGIVVVQKRAPERGGLSYLFELVVICTGVGWKFFSILRAVPEGGGLAEFLIGVMGLTLLRIMSWRRASVVFAGLTVIFAGVISAAGAFDIEQLMSAAIFATFAVIWSASVYNGKVLEFLNSMLLEELNRQNRNLQAMALRDPLTGLPNRRYFEQFIDHLWEEDHPGATVALIIADIDHFKQYNDTYGHPEGDRCLHQVGRALASVDRADSLCARLGGEEFVVVLSHATPEETATVAEELRRTVARHAPVTISVGFAWCHAGTTTREELYNRADTALYHAKEGGRNRVVGDGE